MAAVSLSPAPQAIEIMSNRRMPLANVPHGANSPYRSVAAAAAAKRLRIDVEAQEDLVYDQEPPSKRQAVEHVPSRLLRTPPRRNPLQHPESHVFNRKPSNSQPTAFERKLHAARDRQAQQKIERQEKAATESLDVIRQWQKHYRRVFPCFVFYFESVPDEVRLKCSKYVRTLGAREEKFFSKDVTHVVTTRPVPLESDDNSPTESAAPATTSTASQAVSQPRTANPTLDQAHPPQPRNKFLFESSLGRKAPVNGTRDGEPRKQNAGNVDILLKAKEMGMKIWQLEKLQRVMSTMFDGATESQSQQGRTSRSVANLGGVDEKHVDLSRMLRNERVNGPSDRDAMAALSETIPFKGPYIYIRDMDEKTKPVMVREYRRVARNETGDWPQFWSVSAGKCPFVEEVEKVREEDVKSAPRTRAMTALEKAKSHLPEAVLAAKQKQPLGEPRYGANSAVALSEKNKNQSFCAPPPSVPTRGRSPTKGSKSVSTAVGPRLFGGEPAASGMQPSNITSAIRSQMVSSTAAAPGAKAGTSKEFQGLKRKVLERNNGPALNAVQNSQRTGNLSRPARAERSIVETRQTRGKAQEKLFNINEDATLSEEEDALRVDETKRADKSLSKSTKAKDLKPGYCENCRDKYDDFDEHIVGRKHRKFALTRDNWKDLDMLLVQLVRKPKEGSD